jgi:peptidoglycan/LPS O-acetylase OafA/YrhL
MATSLPTRALDTLRAAAVLCVLADHTIVAQTGETLPLWILGRLGVLIFFVHTALVLMSSLERQADGAIAFYMRRAFRIYPLSIATVLAVVALGLPSSVVAGAGTFVNPTGTELLANLTLTTNLAGARNVPGPLWSLPLEVQMYSLLPLCFIVALRGVRPVIGLLGLACALWFVQRAEPHLWRANILAFAPIFLLGVLVYAWLRTHRIVDLPLSPLTRAAHTIATYSYGIYLLHVPALAVAFIWARSLPIAMQWGLYAVLMVTLPVAAYHAIEAPGILFGQRIASAHVRAFVERA